MIISVLLNAPEDTIVNKVIVQFNFVGKLLGPKGNSLKRLQEDTMTKMAILGKGSMRDKNKVNTQTTKHLSKNFTSF